MIQYHRRWVEPERYLRRWLDPRLSVLRVADVVAYLQRHGWTPVPPDRPQTLVFREPNTSSEPLYQFVPDSETDPDYFRRMVELITLLAFFEDRHPTLILDEVTGSTSSLQTNGLSGAPAHDLRTTS